VAVNTATAIQALVRFLFLKTLLGHPFSTANGICLSYCAAETPCSYPVRLTGILSFRLKLPRRMKISPQESVLFCFTTFFCSLSTTLTGSNILDLVVACRILTVEPLGLPLFTAVVVVQFTDGKLIPSIPNYGFRD